MADEPMADEPMADEPTRGGPPPSDPLQGWPDPPDRAGSTRPPGLPPSAPPPGWGGATPPWAQAAPQSGKWRAQAAQQSTERPHGAMGGPTEPPPHGASGAGPLAALRSRRGMVLVGGLVVLLLAAALVVVVVSGRDEGGTTLGGGRTAGTGKDAAKASAATPGGDVPVLDGRLVVTTPPGWELLETSVDTASVRVELRAPGRDLVATLVMAALPAGSALDVILTVDGGTRFDVTTKVAGPLQATAVPGLAARVVWGSVRPNATFFFSLSVAALDGKDVDAAFLQQLFVEQVAPQVRFP